MSAQRVRMLPVAYACSGCSSAGHLADHVARTLDAQGEVEMGSLAGIGAGEAQQLSKARSRFPIYAIDGCANACARTCLERQGIQAVRHFVLTRHDVVKRNTAAGLDLEEADRVLQAIRAELHT